MWRHTVGTPTADDVLVYEEADERFWVGVELTRSEQFIVIDVHSKVTSEVLADPGRRPDRRAAPWSRRAGRASSTRVEHARRTGS